MFKMVETFHIKFIQSEYRFFVEGLSRVRLFIWEKKRLFLDKSPIDRSGEQVEKDLVVAINTSDKISMIMRNGFNCGYVKIKVD